VPTEHAHASSSSSSGCTSMVNHYDTQFTATVSVGSNAQDMSVIPDSGSFELVLDSTMCSTDGCKAHYQFNPSPSISYVSSTSDTVLSYGQGQVACDLAEDTVSLDGFTATNQSLLLMTDELLEGFSDAAFDGIMGMGKNDASETGATALLTTMGVGAFGVCLGRESEDNGRLDLADSVSSLPSMYTSSATSLTAIGDYHWGLRLSGLGIKTSSGETYLSGYGSNPCDSGANCAAVIDSGTTLIMGPSDHLNALLTLVDETVPGKLDELYAQSTCDGVDALPNLLFDLGEEKEPIELAPEQYMGAALVQKWEKIWRFKRSTVAEACVPLFQTDETMTESNGPMYILGLPFFRQHAVGFDRSSTPKISFADNGGSGCTSCYSARMHEQQETSLQPPPWAGGKKHSKKHRGLRFNPERARRPFWLPKNHSRAFRFHL